MTITAPATRLEDKTTARIFWAGAERETVRIERPRPDEYRGRHRRRFQFTSEGLFVSLLGGIVFAAGVVGGFGVMNGWS